METIKVVIEKTSDYYDAYAENCEGVYGAGATVEEAKRDVAACIEALKASRPREEWPKALRKEYVLAYEFDIKSLLGYCNTYFSNVSLERLTGINQKQLFHYASGLRKPRMAQRKKIVDALHKLGEDLLSVI